MIVRKIFEKLWSAIRQEYVDILVGPRHSGKSTLFCTLMAKLRSEKMVHDNRIFYFDFDDILVRIEFEPVLDAFKKKLEMKLGESLEQLHAPIYLFFDEIQTCPEMLPILRALFQTNPSKIKTFAASSISFKSIQRDNAEFAACSRIIELPPLSLNELICHYMNPLQGNSTITSIINRELDADIFRELQTLVQEKREAILRLFELVVLFGGMPEVMLQDDVDQKWAATQQSLRDYFEKDIHPLSQIADLKKYNQILKILSIHNGELFNILNICDDYGLNRNTVRKYISTMEETFVLDFVNPYLEDDVKKVVMRTPKLFFRNNGWVHYWAGYRQFEALQNSNRLQPSLEGVLYHNLICHAKLTGEPVDIRFLKDYQNHSLDFLICRDNELIPVGICYDLNTQKNKIRNFRYFLKYCPQISQGVLFGNFDTIAIKEMRGSTLFLLPLWMIW